MEDILYKFGYWIVTSIFALAGLMIWGRVNDRFKVLEKQVADIQTEHDSINEKLSKMELNIVTKLGELKDSLEKKYVSKEVCAFFHKGDQ
jgi:hypothetical protein